jgi:hypothetical protein
MLNTAPKPTCDELATYLVASNTLDGLVAELKKELPGISFGYIENFESWGDERSFYLFLPVVGRMGNRDDMVSLGAYSSLPKAVERWELIAASARKLYHNGSLRTKKD